MALRHGPAGAAGILSGLAGRSLRRRFPARRASRCARTAASDGVDPLPLTQTKCPWREVEPPKNAA